MGNQFQHYTQKVLTSRNHLYFCPSLVYSIFTRPIFPEVNMYKIALEPDDGRRHETTEFESLVPRLNIAVYVQSGGILLEGHVDRRAIVISAASRDLAVEALDRVMASGILPTNWGDWSIKHRFVP